MPKHECIDVVFLRGGDDLFAVFPDVAGDMDYASSVQCYAHVGQHHCVDLGYCIDCEEVTDMGEYADLAHELREIGYILCVVPKDSLCSDDYTNARREQVQL